MPKIAALALFALAACATQKPVTLRAQATDKTHPIFMGHADTGEVIMAASHYDAMSGFAVAASDVGAPGEGDLLCRREMLTGTHIPKWVCRYPSEVEKERNATREMLDAPAACAFNCTAGEGMNASR